MARQTINVGSSANSGGGDALRDAMIKINSNFAELYNTLGSVSALADGQLRADIQGSIFADDSTLLVDAVNGSIPASVLTGALPAIDGSALTGISGGGGLADLVDDTTPQLGGNLDLNNFDITGTGDIPAANLTGTLPALDGSSLTGVTASSVAFTDVTATPTTLAGYGITDAVTAGGDFEGNLSGSVFADDSTLLVDGVNGTLNSSALTKPIALADNEKIIFGDDDDLEIFHNASNGNTIIENNTGNLVIKGSNLFLQSASSEYFFRGAANGAVTLYYDNVAKFETTADGISVTGKITGLTDPTAAQDAATKAYVDANSGGGGAETDPIVGAVNGIVKADGAGNISAAVAGTDYSTFDGAFGSLTGTPTTLSGYGITDALTAGGALTGSGLEPTSVGTGDGNDLTLTGGDATELNSTGGDTNITGGSGALASGNVNIGTTQTVAVSIGASGVGTSIGGTLTANGNAIFNTGVQEAFDTLTSSTGTVTHDCDNGHVFYHTGATGDITANFTNLGLTAEYGTNLTVIINQGATPYEVTAVQIGGVAQTINWQGGSAPTGNANGIDSFSFTILRDGSSYVVLGQMVDFT